VVAGARAGQRLRVVRLVLRGQHRPDLDPPQDARAEQAGGLDAIGHARRTVRRGTPLVVTGGVDSALDPWGWVSQLSSGRVSRTPDPQRAYLPFDEGACGYLPGEGGAILVLESAQGAQRRGRSHAYGEITGYASTFDPPPGSGRPSGLRRAAELAIEDAGVSPDAIDVVFADAAGVPELDAAEAEAIRGIYSGGGPLDVVSALMAIRDGVIPHTAGTTAVPAEYGIEVVTGSPLTARVSTALVLARGRWGFNSAVVVSESVA
jgi:act minimal PKS chain-length factor (CLF/KS beta)